MSAFQGENLRFVIGLFVVIVSLFMILSFTSHFFSGWQEQTAIESGNSFEAENFGGCIGAYISYYFMDGCFGVSAYFIPVFFFFLGIKLMRVYKIRLWICFVHCGILLVWLSVAFSLLQNTFWNDLKTNITFNWAASMVKMPASFYVQL